MAMVAEETAIAKPPPLWEAAAGDTALMQVLRRVVGTRATVRIVSVRQVSDGTALVRPSVVGQVRLIAHGVVTMVDGAWCRLWEIVRIEEVER